VSPSDLPSVNPATLNGMILYYRLMTKWSGLRDSTKLSRVGLSHVPTRPTIAPTLAILVLSVHPTVFFLFLFFLILDP
jgi:hypothetical protein